MLDKIRIKNYKSLKDAELLLKPLTVLVGPNNAGKSNTLNSFHFIQDIVKRGNPNAIAARGGFNDIAWNGKENQIISFDISWTPDNEDGQIACEYHIEITPPFNIKTELFSVAEHSEGWVGSSATELLRVGKSKATPLVSYAKNGKRILSRLDGTEISSTPHNPEQSALSLCRPFDQYEVLGKFAREILNWSFLGTFTSQMRRQSPIEAVFNVSEQGENAASVLHTIHTENIDDFNKIQELLQKAVPEITKLRSILSTTQAGHVYIGINEKDLTLNIPAWAMSDGTLRLIAQLASIYSPNPSPLICIEEPENSLHPGLMELVANILKKGSEKTQILVTTHSPYLLNYLEPENVRVVQKKNGETVIEPMPDMKKVLGVLGLGDAWLGNSDLGGAVPVGD